VKNKIEDLRNHLFATLEDLRDTEKPMDIARAKAIAEVGQVIVDSAKAENDFIKLTRSKGSGFIPVQLPTGSSVDNASQRQIPSEVGPSRLSSIVARCPDPNCGGILSPQTNGNGGLKDVCDKCHRVVTPVLKSA
jgi:hypothetical protein